MSFNNNSLYKFGEFTLNISDRLLQKNGEILSVAPKTIETLIVLVKNNDKLVTKDTLMEEIWADTFVEDRNIAQHIFRLRKILGESDEGKKFIQTVPRRGYRFVADVETKKDIDIEKTDSLDAKKSNGFDQKDSRQNKNIPQGKFKTLASFAIATSLITIIGATFWYFIYAEKSSELTISPKTISFERLTESGDAFFPAISSDERNFAFVKNSGDSFSIVLRNIGSKGEKVLVEPQEHELRSLHFSPEGDFLYYAIRDPEQAESTVYRIPVIGGDKERLLTGVRQEFTISPNGRNLAFFRYIGKKKQLNLVVFNLDEKTEKVIATRTRPKFWGVWGGKPAWSPEGRKLLVVGSQMDKDKAGESNRKLFEVDIESGKETRIPSPNWGYIFQAYYSITSNILTVLAKETTESPTQFWHLNVATGEASKITNDTTDYREFGVTKDSILFTKHTETANLYTLELQNPSKIKQLTNQTEVLVGKTGIDFSRDGQKIYYAKNEIHIDGNIWEYNLKTNQTKPLTADKNWAVKRVQTGISGNTIFFSIYRKGVWHTWQMDSDGKNLEKITDAKGGDMPEPTTDGKWLIYSYPGDKPKELRKLPIKDGRVLKDEKPITILQNAHGKSESSPKDSDMIFAGYFDPRENIKDPWRLILSSVKSEPNYESISSMSSSELSNLFVWDKDGNGLYYLKRMKKSNSLWYFNFVTKQKKKITDFENLYCSQLSLSPDGQSLALSCGEISSNVFLIGNKK